MAKNSYFLHGSQSEQRLVQDLINEQLKIYGLDVTYIPRKFVNTKSIIEEVQSSKFDDNFVIEAYVNSYDGYSGAGDVLTKFGMSLRDEVELTISKERFEDFIAPFMSASDDINLASRPREGDLIFFPLGQRLFEVKFVEHEEPFYQLGKGYVYKLKAELFEYSDEQGDVFDNDEEIVDYGYTVKHFYLTTAGTTATGTSVLTGGELTNIFITDNGSSYNETPLITITGDGQDAAAEAFMANITVSGGSPTKSAVIRSVVKDGQIRSVNIVDGGENYDEDRAVLNVTAPDAGGIAATLVPTFTNGVLTAINILSGGSGYKSVKLIDITNAGSGYTSATIAFTPAPAGLTGAFQVPEQVTGGTTGHTAQLVEWNAQEGFVKLKSPTGSFVVGELIMGATSGATIVLDNKNEMATADPKYSESVTFESLGDDIIDFSESNPFGLVT